MKEFSPESITCYRMLFDKSPMGIFSYSAELIITDCNPRFIAILRVSREKLIGLDMNTLKDHSVLQCLKNPAKGEEGYYEGPYRATTSGAEIWISMHTAPVLDEAGNVISCIGIVEDVTGHKETDAKLQETARKYQKIFENIQDIFYQADLNGNIIEISPSIQRYSGHTREELIGKPIISFYYYAEDRVKLLEALRRKGEVADFEVRLKTIDDRLVYTSVNAHFLLDDAGKPIGMEGSLRDITERKKLEEQLLHSQKMEAIGQLAGGIAHDFNNILSAIIGYGSLLNMQIKEGDPLRYYSEQITESSERAATLTKSLLAFSRKPAISPTLVNLNDVISKVEKFLGRLISEDIELRTKFHVYELPVFVDGGQIEQVIINLATNARDAMPDGGQLSIETGKAELDRDFIRMHRYGEPGEYALITVTDTGIGMDEEIRLKMFEPFFTTKEIGRGTGLGLAMAYSIIKQHDGYINACSEPGKGTTLRIYLPLVPAKKEKSSVELADVFRALPRGTETILVAEDFPALRRLTSTVLSEFGYKVIPAEDGEDAVCKFMENKESINLLVFDIVMPKRNGKEAYEEIKKIRPDIKTLFVSGYTADLIQRKSVLHEGFDFIMKPVSPRDLLKKVREILDERS